LNENLNANDPAFLAKTRTHAKFMGTKNNDEWCSVDSLANDAPEPVMLKIDVEGCELDVLHGARSLLESGSCLLVVETHSVELERDCVAFLEELGYKTQVIDNAWYRVLIPESRPLPHNRWLSAER